MVTYTTLELTNKVRGTRLILSNEPSNFDVVLEHILWEPVTGDNNYVGYINMIGSALMSTILIPRRAELKAWLIADNEAEMLDKKAVVKRFFNPKQDIDIVYKDWTIEVKPDTSVRFNDLDPDRENNEILCTFLVQLTAKMPLWQLKDRVIMRESIASGVPLFPFVSCIDDGFIWGIIPAEAVRNPNNEGDVDVGFIIRIKAAHGAVTNPKITNQRTGTHIEILAEMAHHDEIELSTIMGNQYIRLFRGGIYETNIFNAHTTASSMSMTLGVGENELTISAIGNSENIETEIFFSPMWFEVQQ